MSTDARRTIRLGGVEVTVALDREWAERVKASPLYRAVRRSTPLPWRNGEPVLNGRRIEEIDWYQTIDLGNGVVTPGFVDHRPDLHRFPFPASLAGKQCLDVATADGFWAFEMERRGAAEVIGVDVFSRYDYDYPANFRDQYVTAVPNQVKGEGFAYAKRARGSRVQRRVCNIYDLSPARLGTFDFVFVSDILLHLREPLRAMEAVWRVMRPGAQAIFADAYDPELDKSGLESITRFTVQPDNWAGAIWWFPSVSWLKWALFAARFKDVEEVDRYEIDTNVGIKVPKVILTARRED